MEDTGCWKSVRGLRRLLLLGDGGLLEIRGNLIDLLAVGLSGLDLGNLLLGGINVLINWSVLLNVMTRI